jgi:hypothetical protein
VNQYVPSGKVIIAAVKKSSLNMTSLYLESQQELGTSQKYSPKAKLSDCSLLFASPFRHGALRCRKSKSPK